jgi:Type VI secretion system, TssN
MTRIFSQEIIRLIGILGLAGLSLMVVLGVYINKLKGSFAPYRKATILYLLVCTFFCALPGFLGIPSIFSPAITLIICQVIFCLMGFLHIKYMHQYLKWSNTEKSFWLEVIFTFVLAAFGFMAFLIVFSWMNTEGYQILISSSVCFFVIAYFIYYSFLLAVKIPMKVYSKWYYPVHEEIDDPDEKELKNMLVISFEFQKKITDKHFTNFRAKAPADMEFGQLFYYFINDYNERHPNGNIEFVNEQANPYGWMFYKKTKWYHFGSKYIDTDKTFFTNHIRENDVIVCTRV